MPELVKVYRCARCSAVFRSVLGLVVHCQESPDCARVVLAVLRFMRGAGVSMN